MKKKVVLLAVFLLTIFISINDVNAKIMWIQCKQDGSIYAVKNDADNSSEKDDDFSGYGTYALIDDNQAKAQTRWLSFDKNAFYAGGKGPVFLQHKDAGGTTDAINCWRNDWFYKVEECDPKEGYSFYAETDGEIPLDHGVCPAGVVQTGNSSGSVRGDFLVLYGTQREPAYKNASISAKGEWVIYGFQKEGGQVVDKIVEGYTGSGVYGYATTWKNWDAFEDNLGYMMDENNDGDDLISYHNGYSEKYMSWTAMTQAKRIRDFHEHYFELTTYETADGRKPWLIYAAHEGRKFVEKTTGTDGIYYSNNGEGKANLTKWVDDWYKDASDILSVKLEARGKIKGKNKLIDAAEGIDKASSEGKEYVFKSNYSASQMIKDLEESYQYLADWQDNDAKFYAPSPKSCSEPGTTSDPSSAISTSFLCETVGVPDLRMLNHRAYSVELNTLIRSTLTEMVNNHSNSDEGIETLAKDAEKYTREFTVAINYLNKYHNNYGLDSNIGTLKNNYDEMLKKYRTEVILDCEGLLGEELQEKINSYLNIIKIAVPIILIGFGIIDFTKALFAGDDDQMKKAQKDFMLRIAIAILFFLLPTIVNLLLSIANKVWFQIDPVSCGLFGHK